MKHYISIYQQNMENYFYLFVLWNLFMLNRKKLLSFF